MGGNSGLNFGSIDYLSYGEDTNLLASLLLDCGEFRPEFIYEIWIEREREREREKLSD